MGGESTLNEGIKSFDSFFKNHSKVDLIKAMAGLSVYESNHGKSNKLDFCSIYALEIANNSGDVLAENELSNFLTTFFPAETNGTYPENIFINQIVAFGRNFSVFTGTSLKTPFWVKYLLLLIYQNSFFDEPKYDSFKRDVFGYSRLLLALSHEVAKRLGYPTDINTNFESPTIAFPDNKRFEELKAAVSFTKQEFAEIASKHLISPKYVDDYIFEGTEISPTFDPVDNILIFKPLYYENNYTVLSPHNICLTITHKILQSALNNDCLIHLILGYHEHTFMQTVWLLKKIKFAPIDIDIEVENNLNVRESFFGIDTDKLAYLLYAFDDAYHPRQKQVSDFESESNWEQNTANRRDFVLTQLQTLEAYKNKEILVITCISDLVNNIGITTYNEKGCLEMAVSPCEIEMIVDSNKADAISLWKFVYSLFLKEISAPTILDAFAFYLQHKHSFYHDDSKRNVLDLSGGFSVPFIYDTITKRDRHLVLHDFSKNGFRHCEVERRDAFVPTYWPVMPIYNKPEILLNGFSIPIWIVPDNNIKGASKKILSALIQIQETISYWLWESKLFLNQYFENTDKEYVRLFFKVDDLVKFDDELSDKPIEVNKLFERFSYQIFGKYDLELTIPHEFSDVTCLPNNEADRVLLKSLLNVFIHWTTGQNNLELISDKIIDEIAPKGSKKKLYSLDPFRNHLLIPAKSEVPFKYIQDADDQIVLDQFLPFLEDKRPELGLVHSLKEKKEILKNIVLIGLLPKLNQILSKYDSGTILKRLIRLTEVAITRREKFKLSVVTEQACFGHYVNYEGDLKEKDNKSDVTNKCLRCLIEHVAASNHFGITEVSQTDLDMIIALMQNIIGLGSYGDMLQYFSEDIITVELKILDSGRISLKSNLYEVYDKYHTELMDEFVEKSNLNFKHFFVDRTRNQNGGLSDDTELSAAFGEVYGLPLTRLVEILRDLSHHGVLAKQADYIETSRDGLLTILNEVLEVQCSAAEIDLLLEHFALKNRDGVINVPPGMRKSDISPWQHNRRLSLLMRPFIIVNEKGNEKIIYGPKQLFDSLIFILEKLDSGRLYAPEKSRLERLMGKITKKESAKLNADTYLLINSWGDGIVKENIFIDKDSPYYSPENIGDIDVFFISKKNKTLFSIECKDTYGGKNPYELAGEIQKLFQDKKSWSFLHLRRHDWLEANKELVGNLNGIDLSDYKIKSLVVTGEIISAGHHQFARQILPIINFRQLKNKGIDALL